MELNCSTAENALVWAERQNPGKWAAHSRFAALACKNIASRCEGMSAERHLIDGYRFCIERGWEKAAQICISHAFMIQDIRSSIGTFDVTETDFRFLENFVKNAVYDDYDRLVQLCDALALPTGFCILEKRFVDVTIRYGVHPYTVDRWKKVLEIKADFEGKINGSIYDLLPGAIENSL